MALHAVEVVDADGSIKAAHDREALDKAWQILVPVLMDKGLFFKSGDVNTSETQSWGFDKVEGDSIAPTYPPCQLPISEVPEFILAPGAQARGTVVWKRFWGPMV